MFYTYILLSECSGRYYIGSSQNLESRLNEHNAKKVRSTKSYVPWKIVYSEVLATRADAVAREKLIKSYKSGTAFKKLLSL